MSGCNHARIAAILRSQILPTIYRNALSCRIVLNQRCGICLTGARAAGVVGKIITNDRFSEVVSKIEPLSFDCFSKHICLASWVDHIWFLSNIVHKTIMFQGILEQHLACKWDYSLSLQEAVYCV